MLMRSDDGAWWVPASPALGQVAMLADLMKGANHKYWKRVPTGHFTKTGRPKYRYFYKLTGSRGIGLHSDLQVGTGLRGTSQGQIGHFHIEKIHGSGHVTIRHDESGRVEKIHRDELVKRLETEHAKSISTEKRATEKRQSELREKRVSELAAATRHGSERQIEAARKRAESIGADTKDPRVLSAAEHRQREEAARKSAEKRKKAPEPEAAAESKEEPAATPKPVEKVEKTSKPEKKKAAPKPEEKKAEAEPKEPEPEVVEAAEPKEEPKKAEPEKRVPLESEPNPEGPLALPEGASPPADPPVAAAPSPSVLSAPDDVAVMAQRRTDKQRREANAKAVALAKRLQATGAEPTEAERKVLAAYTGEGGIGDSLNQYFTRPDLALALWQMIKRLSGGDLPAGAKVLEPACGAGVFLSTAPAGVGMTGVEIDEDAAAVARALHGKHDIRHASLEAFSVSQTGKPPGYDAVIGNAPFCVRTGNVQRLHKPEFSNADRYFLDTSLDHAKDGGLVTMIVHRGVMSDGTPAGSEFRSRLLARAELMDAYRLPDTAFKHAGTSVVADVIVLRKRDAAEAAALSELHRRGRLGDAASVVGDDKVARVIAGEFFDAHPDRVLGKVETVSGQFGPTETVTGTADSLPDLIARLSKSPTGVGGGLTREAMEGHRDNAEVDLSMREALAHALVAVPKSDKPPAEGDIATFGTGPAMGRYVFLDGEWKTVSNAETLGDLIARTGDDKVREAVDIGRDIAEMLRARDGQMRDGAFVEGDYYRARALRRALETRISAWVEANGAPRNHKAIKKLSEAVPELTHLLAAVDADGKLTDAIRKDPVVRVRPVESLNSDSLQAVAEHLGHRHGEIDPQVVSQMWSGAKDLSVDAVRAKLLAMPDVMEEVNGTLKHREDFLTGRVYDKLEGMQTAAAEAARRGDTERAERFGEQAKALESVIQAKRRSIDNADLNIAQRWIPDHVLTAFLGSEQGLDAWRSVTTDAWSGRREKTGHGTIKGVEVFSDGPVRHARITGEVITKDGPRETRTEEYTGSLAHPLMKYLNGLGCTREQLPEFERVNAAFNDWLKGSDHATNVEDIYNRRFFGDVAPRYSGESLGISGMGPNFKPHAHQNEGVRWAEDTGRGIIAFKVGVGKQHPIDTKVLTPEGWREIGTICVGDRVIGSDGRPVTVLGVHPQGVKPSYRVRFSDQSSVEAGPEHLWTVAYHSNREWRVITVTTDVLRLRPTIVSEASTGQKFGLDLSKTRLMLPMLSGPVEFSEPSEALPIHPYLTGLLIANGSLTSSNVSFTINTLDRSDIERNAATHGFALGSANVYGGATRIGALGVGKAARALGMAVLSGAKRIPDIYKTASVSDRINLFQGMMDGDGSISATGNRISYSTTSKCLAFDFQGLVECLGGIASVSAYDRTDEGKGIEYDVRVRVPSWLPPFSVTRKLNRFKPSFQAAPKRSVQSVDYVRDVESVCISVDAADSLYVTEHCIVTHNTFTGAMLAKHLRDSGKVKRPLITIPKSVTTNWEREIKTAFPDARVLVIGETQLASGKKRTDSPAERDQKLSKMQQGDYDFVLITRPALHAIPLTPTTIDRLENDPAKWTSFANVRKKELDNAKNRKTEEAQSKAEVRAKAAFEAERATREIRAKRGVLFWEDLNIDCVIADEAHAYKNLEAAKSRYGAKPKYLGGSATSKMSLDMLYKTELVRERAKASDPNANGHVFMLTATPAKNSPLELYNMLAQVAPEEMVNRGINNAEDFIDRYCKVEIKPSLSLKSQKDDAPGGGKAAAAEAENETEDDAAAADLTDVSGDIVEAPCVTGFHHLSELQDLLNRYMNVKTAEDVGIAVPKKPVEEVFVPMTSEQKNIYRDLQARLRGEGVSDEEKDDPALMLRALTDMSQVSQDLHTYGGTVSRRDGSENAYAREHGMASPKYNEAVRRVIEGAATRGGQIMFAEQHVAQDLLREMLIKKGMKPEHIGMINATVTPDSGSRQAVADAFNRGDIKVVIGNTATMGEGVNLHGREHAKGTTDIHHVDLPWDPGTMDQREGRGCRQGNPAAECKQHLYLSQDSFDGYRAASLRGKKKWLDSLRSGADEIENESDLTSQFADFAEMAKYSSDTEKAEEFRQAREKVLMAKWTAQQRGKDHDRFHSLQRDKAAMLKASSPERKKQLEAKVRSAAEQLSKSEHLTPAAIAALGDPKPVAMGPDGAILQVGKTYQTDKGTFRVVSVDPTKKEVGIASYGDVHGTRGVMRFDALPAMSRLKDTDHTPRGELAHMASQGPIQPDEFYTRNEYQRGRRNNNERRPLPGLMRAFDNAPKDVAQKTLRDCVIQRLAKVAEDHWGSVTSIQDVKVPVRIGDKLQSVRAVDMLTRDEAKGVYGKLAAARRARGEEMKGYASSVKAYEDQAAEAEAAGEKHEPKDLGGQAEIILPWDRAAKEGDAMRSARRSLYGLYDY